MGLFGNLFSKKGCAFCGSEIGLLGNKKLEDGNMCKNCAEKLSPWFSERRHSTVMEIAEQLEYREANRARVDAFRVTHSYGEGMKLLLDWDAQCFMVTRATNLRAANPDVIDLADVTSCEADIRQSRHEVYQEGPDGKRVSYDPKRYEFEFDYYIRIHVKNPYFDVISFRLCPRDIKWDERQLVDYYRSMAEDIVEVLTGVRPNLWDRTPMPPPPPPVHREPPRPVPAHHAPAHEEPAHREPPHPVPAHHQSPHEEPEHREPPRPVPAHHQSAHAEPAHPAARHAEPVRREPPRGSGRGF